MAVTLVLNWLAPEAMLVGPIALAIFLTGAVLSARLSLHVHTPAQIYAGFGSGLLLPIVAAYVGL